MVHSAIHFNFFKGVIEQKFRLDLSLNPSGQTGIITTPEEIVKPDSATVEPSLDEANPAASVIDASGSGTALKVRNPHGGKTPMQFTNYRISQAFGASDGGKLTIQGFDPSNEIIMADCLNMGNNVTMPVVVSLVRFTLVNPGVLYDTATLATAAAPATAVVSAADSGTNMGGTLDIQNAQEVRMHGITGEIRFLMGGTLTTATSAPAFTGAATISGLGGTRTFDFRPAPFAPRSNTSAGFTGTYRWGGFSSQIGTFRP